MSASPEAPPAGAQAQDSTPNNDLLPPYELSTGEEATMTTLERRNSLEKHLQRRPDEKDLKDRHILLDTTAAPALQARQAELERQKITDNLKKGLSKRPEAAELVERNILPDSKAAPAIQAQQKELENQMRADSLEKALQSRPEKEELVKEGILKDTEA